MSMVSGASTNAAWVAGGYEDEDEHAGEALWGDADDGTWQPECWSKSPIQLQEEARAMNEAAFASAAAGADRHSNPPLYKSHLRPF